MTRRGACDEWPRYAAKSRAACRAMSAKQWWGVVGFWVGVAITLLAGGGR